MVRQGGIDRLVDRLRCRESRVRAEPEPNNEPVDAVATWSRQASYKAEQREHGNRERAQTEDDGAAEKRFQEQRESGQSRDAESEDPEKAAFDDEVAD